MPSTVPTSDAAPNATLPPLVRVRGLHFSRGSRKIYDGVDVDIARGRITAIMGPSGTGKTTLLRIIGGQWQPSAGAVEFDGLNVHRQSRAGLYALRKRMSLLFQNGALLTDLSVFENVAFPLREHTRLPEAAIRDIVLMKLEAVGLRGARDLYPEELSGGMARRVALARAIALDPEMVMYDEPFTGQDPISMGVLLRLIRSLNQSLGITSVIVSHDVAEVLSIADYAYVVAGGQIQARGTPDEIRASPLEYVQQFLQGRPDGPVAFHYKARTLADDLLGQA
ncbi:ABC transporter ATP-binding protein [Solimonas soli]|uniref:ABC transporter ATP-binding protein n=1 Tax=Solimonas soli TaxID=413479 RepID=UPI0005BB8D43|nr:ABC transporter ATP-binding protein [Solimonas soli]